MAKKVAVEDLYVGSIIVHRAGSEVDEDDVKQWGWSEFVVGPNTKAAKAATPSQDPAVGAGGSPSTANDSARAAEKTNGASAATS